MTLYGLELIVDHGRGGPYPVLIEDLPHDALGSLLAAVKNGEGVILTTAAGVRWSYPAGVVVGVKATPRTSTDKEPS